MLRLAASALKLFWSMSLRGQTDLTNPNRLDLDALIFIKVKTTQWYSHERVYRV